jgi:hypothetical protein
MIRKICPLMVGVLLGIGALAAFAPFASAAPPVVPAGVNSGNPNIISVAKWDRERHGSRCEYRRGECRHFYRGYYYETPWWTLPFAAGEGIGSNRYYDGEDDYYDDDEYDNGGWDNSHIEWCLNRYRSYNPRNNTWVSYSGRMRKCISPF